MFSKGIERDQWYEIPVGIYLLKVNNKDTRTRCEIRSKLTIKTPEQRQWERGTFRAYMNN